MVFTIDVCAQSFTQRIDSLKNIAQSGSDIDRVVAYTDLMFMLSYQDVKQSVEYGELAFALADELGIDTLSLYAHRIASETYAEWGRNIEALRHAQIALEIQTKLNHPEMYVIINNIGDIYFELNDYEQAYRSFQNSLQLSREIGDEFMEGMTMFNIGRVYKVQANYPMALEYIGKSKATSTRIDDIAGIAYSDYELGMISQLMGNSDEAKEYLEKAISLSDSLNLYQLSAQSMVSIAGVYKEENNYLKSLEYYHQSLKESKSINDYKGIAEAYLGLGELQLLMNSVESASESLHKGLGYANTLSAKKLEYQFYNQLSSFYEKKGKPEEALNYYKKFKTLSDSVFDKDVNIQVALMETQYESVKKDKEIAQLNVSKTSQNAKIEKQNFQTLVLVFGLILLAVMVVVAVFIGVNRRKANDMLRQQKEEITTKNSELNKLNKVKDKFFTIISHDLKSPFQSLSGILELMSMNALSDREVKKLFKDLKLKFDGTNALLENLLEWARMQMKETKFDPNQVELHATVEEELTVIKNSKFKDIDLQNNVEKVALAHADMNMFKLVIRNLVSNAVKFTKKNGNIEVLSEDMGDFVCISVKDNGIGISEENKQKIFSEESSVTTLGTELESGTGLGLNLCKEFIEMHGGKIWVESEEGKGSVFKFTLKKAS
jgi:signal transduction histidine kinase